MDGKKERIKALDRRSFIKAGSFLGLGSFVVPKSLIDSAVNAPQTGCDPTTDDIQGPFYLAGSPATTMIAGPGEPGTRLYISGSVFNNDCMTPIPNAMIEVWQANDAAQYDTSSSFNLRGTMYSDANGNYAFETIMPGAYLNGSQFRPKHLHYKVSKIGFPTLVTQLYFQGDPYIAADPWASDPDAVARIINLNTLAGGELEGVFDIVLDGFVGIKPNRFGEDGDLLPVHPNPSGEITNIHFNVFRKAHVQVTIANLEGKEVITLIDNQLAQGRFTTQWSGESANGGFAGKGVYLAVLRMDSKIIKTQRIVRL